MTYTVNSSECRAINIACIVIFTMFISLSFLSKAQDNSDIYLGVFEFSPHNNTSSKIHDIKQLTDTAAYTNQPYFFNQQDLYFTQAVGDETAQQMDIFVYKLNTHTISNISDSAQSEYSPTPMPAQKGLSVIRVNKQGKQELWALANSGKAIEHLAPDIEPVGYQVWLNEAELLLFVLGEPHTLQRVSIHQSNNTPTVIDENIGASLFRLQQTEWFLYTKNADTSLLMAYNAETDQSVTVADMPKGSAYFSVTPTGQIISSDGQNIYYRQLVATDAQVLAEGEWHSFIVEHEACQSGVSRTAVSPYGDKIAMVCPRS